MTGEIPIAPTNNPTTRVDLGGDFVFPLALNSVGHQTTLLMSASQFMGLYAEAVEEKDEEEYPSDDYSDEDDDTDYDSDFDSDFFDEYALDDSDPKMRPASKTAIEALENVKIDEELGKSVGMCSVCLEEVAVGTEAKRLPCSHVYHTDCITEWLNGCNMCPLCRHKMPVVDFDLNVKVPSDDFESQLC